MSVLETEISTPVAEPPDAQLWIRNASDELAVRNGCYFDAAAGLRVVRFFEKCLRHSIGKWAGKPFLLMDWQRKDFIMPIFGWKRPDGSRRFRVAYVEIPKKNGKSSTLSGLALYGLCADNEPGAQVFGLGSDKDQASIIYREAAAMVRASPGMTSRLDVLDSTKRINYLGNNGFYRVLSAEAFRQEGLNPHFSLFDELHAQPDRRLWDTMRWAGAARRQPLLIAITTAGTDVHSICYEEREYGMKVNDGTIPDDQYFAYIRAAEKDDDWMAEETWNRANPSMGVTINLEDFKRDCTQAQNSPKLENPFKRYRLNIWTEQADRWIQMSRWTAIKQSPPALNNLRCYGGLDLSSNGDLTAMGLLFPLGEDYPQLAGMYGLVMKFWLPELRLEERGRADRVPYGLWAKQGLISLTPGDVIDYAFIRRDINALKGLYCIASIGFDPWNATQLSQELAGQDGFEMVEFRQGFKTMSPAAKEFERLVVGGKLLHGNNPVLNWMMTNAVVETDPAGNIKPTKDPKRARGRIDGVVAAVMSVGLAMANNGGKGSVYETRGIRQL